MVHLEAEKNDIGQIDRLMDGRDPGPPADWDGDDGGSPVSASEDNLADEDDQDPVISDDQDQDDEAADDDSIDGAPSLR